METQVKIEILRLQSQGIIAPVDPGGVMKASVVVWQRKKDGYFSLCAVFKVHVNEKIMTEDYPLPHMEAVFHDMAGSKFHIENDLSTSKDQLMLDDVPQFICVINSMLGLCKLLRLPRGLKNASGMFQRTIENHLKRLVGAISFRDDALVHRRKKCQCEKRWRAIQDRLKDKGFTITEFKSGNIMEKITFLGFTISRSGIHPDDCLVNKVRKLHPPQTGSQTVLWIGQLLQQVHPELHFETYSLSDLRKRSGAEFQWTETCKRAFERLKADLASEPVVQPYSLNKE